MQANSRCLGTYFLRHDMGRSFRICECSQGNGVLDLCIVRMQREVSCDSKLVLIASQEI